MIKIVNKREKETVDKRTNKRKFERDRAMQIDEQKEKAERDPLIFNLREFSLKFDYSLITNKTILNRNIKLPSVE